MYVLLEVDHLSHTLAYRIQTQSPTKSIYKQSIFLEVGSLSRGRSRNFGGSLGLGGIEYSFKYSIKSTPQILQSTHIQTSLISTSRLLSGLKAMTRHPRYCFGGIKSQTQNVYC